MSPWSQRAASTSGGAPSCFGEEPWRFLVARRDDAWRNAVEATLKEGNAWARRAAVLIVGAAKGSFSRNGKPNRWAGHDLGIALGHMMAEARARGLITHAMGGFDVDAIRNSFDVPQDHDVLRVLAVGHYDPELDDEELESGDNRARARRPLKETVFGPRFGEAVAL